MALSLKTLPTTLMYLHARMFLIKFEQQKHSSTNPTQVYLEGGDYVKVAGQAAADLYGYGHNNVLFKPTKAS